MRVCDSEVKALRPEQQLRAYILTTSRKQSRDGVPQKGGSFVLWTLGGQRDLTIRYLCGQRAPLQTRAGRGEHREWRESGEHGEWWEQRSSTGQGAEASSES